MRRQLEARKAELEGKAQALSAQIQQATLLRARLQGALEEVECWLAELKEEPDKEVC